jgi:hypothetical protein
VANKPLLEYVVEAVVDNGEIDVPGEAFIAAKARADPSLKRFLGISDSFPSRML